jgi:hypothetical protein
MWDEELVRQRDDDHVQEGLGCTALPHESFSS